MNIMLISIHDMLSNPIPFQLYHLSCFVFAPWYHIRHRGINMRTDNNRILDNNNMNNIATMRTWQHCSNVNMAMRQHGCMFRRQFWKLVGNGQWATLAALMNSEWTRSTNNWWRNANLDNRHEMMKFGRWALQLGWQRQGRSCRQPFLTPLDNAEADAAVDFLRRRECRRYRDGLMKKLGKMNQILCARF